MAFEYTLPDLEERFLPPEGWQSDDFLNPETNHVIHYNYILPPVGSDKGTIVLLPGLSEFGEKHIETARFLNEQGYGVYIIDWAYQGRSIRLAENPHKRHSDGYDADISDLHYLITSIIKTDGPLYMLAHSMGGNVGLRYLSQYTSQFNAAAFSAPMLGIKDLRYFTGIVKPILGFFFSNSNLYLPSGKDWHEEARSSDGKDIFSHDPVRDKLHNAWCLTNPELQIGNATLKWLYESLKSIAILKDRKILEKITIPVLLATANKEKLVDNKAIERAARIIPHARLLKLSPAKHEIPMEADPTRTPFLREALRTFSL